MNPPPEGALTPQQILAFRRKLMHWYRTHARALPWRGIRDPYRTWVSEVMLQQTRVAAAIDHYERFLDLFPTVVALALAPEDAVLAAWSGLGYYRRARMLHKAAQFLVRERGARIPDKSAVLRTLPGIGDYTCAAIASIAFGESIPVLDGNVERVLLRVTGHAEDPTTSGRAFLHHLASALVPHKRIGLTTNAAGDHNQAMMELGATICLPRSPLCLNCPVYDLCLTRGEHVTQPRTGQKSRRVAYLLATRKQGVGTEVLLERRPADYTLMPGMLELPPLPIASIPDRRPILTLRHSITTTNFIVEIYAESEIDEHADRPLRHAIPVAEQALTWHRLHTLYDLPLTGLTRKVLMRVDLMSVAGPETPTPAPASDSQRDHPRMFRGD